MVSTLNSSKNGYNIFWLVCVCVCMCVKIQKAFQGREKDRKKEQSNAIKNAFAWKVSKLSIQINSTWIFKMEMSTRKWVYSVRKLCFLIGVFFCLFVFILYSLFVILLWISRCQATWASLLWWLLGCRTMACIYIQIQISAENIMCFRTVNST